MDRGTRDRHDAAQLVAFRLGTEEFAIGITQVKEVLRLAPITPLPHSADFIEGVINIRGAVLPVVDLRRRFGFDSDDSTDRTRIIVADIVDEQIGLIVDEVTEVLRVPADNIQAAPGGVSATGGQDVLESLARMDDRLLLILNTNRLLSNTDITCIEQGTGGNGGDDQGPVQG